MTHPGNQNVLRAQLYNLRLAQGRLEELEAPLLDSLAAIRNANPGGESDPRAQPITAGALALLYLLTGRTEQAREWYARLCEHDFAELLDLGGRGDHDDAASRIAARVPPRRSAACRDPLRPAAPPTSTARSC